MVMVMIKQLMVVVIVMVPGACLGAPRAEPSRGEGGRDKHTLCVVLYSDVII